MSLFIKLAPVMSDQPVLMYDGDCGFCRRWVGFARRWTHARVEYAPYQEAGARFPKIPTE